VDVPCISMQIKAEDNV